MMVAPVQVLPRVFFSFLLSFGICFSAMAQYSEPIGEKVEAAAHSVEHVASEEVEVDPAEVIMDHITDSHDWHIMDVKGEHGEMHPISVSLPVILLTDGSLDMFMSSAFEHGHAAVTKGANTYALKEGKIVETSGKSVLDFSITKNAAGMLFSVVIIILLFTSVAASYKKGGAPKGLASFMEPIILFVKDDIAIPNIGEHKAHKFLPYLLTVFFFIWINNIFGLIPIAPFGANITGNIAFTLVLATFTLVITNINGTKAYWSHIFAMPGVPLWLAPIMIPVELIGIISKPFALMIRLFANITAGHVLILGLVMLIFIFKSFYVAPVSIAFMVFLSLLEVLVAALQAYIFTLLSALFIGSAVAEGEHH
ncbi:MAG: F0F1 ATP synthase subunit A [Chitinophagales bacterium]|nr:F0F1 ATP synthase subunit A [Chitinophagales bacterium]